MRINKNKFIAYLILIFLAFIIYYDNIEDSKDIEISELQQKNQKLQSQLSDKQIQLYKVQEKVDNEIRRLNKKRILKESDIDALERIVEAEAENQGVSGKRLVSSVVINRWLDSKNKSIDDVITEKGQFQPVANGRYYSVKPTEETKRAVEMALYKDYSKGSKYFRNPVISDRSTDKFFGGLIPTIKVGEHEFFK